MVSDFGQCEHNGEEAERHLQPAWQLEIEGRNEVEAHQHVDVPQETGVALHGPGKHLDEFVQQGFEPTSLRFNSAAEIGRTEADNGTNKDKGKEELAEFAPLIMKVLLDAVHAFVAVADEECGEEDEKLHVEGVDPCVEAFVVPLWCEVEAHVSQHDKRHGNAYHHVDEL